MPTDNAQLIRRGLDAFLSGDEKALEALLDPDVQWLAADRGPWDCHSRDQVVSVLRARQQQGVPIAVREIVNGGEAVFVDVDGPAFMVVTVRDGRIVRMHGHHTRESALAAAGLAPVPPVAEPAPVEHAEPGWDQVSDLVPFAHVASVEASIAFYERLGFAVAATHPAGAPQLGWAFLEAGSARLMVARADGPVDARRQTILFYLYSRDLFGLRERLVAAGVDAGEIHDGSPGPKAEMNVTDPDGYALVIAQIEGDRVRVS